MSWQASQKLCNMTVLFFGLYWQYYLEAENVGRLGKAESCAKLLLSGFHVHATTME